MICKIHDFEMLFTTRSDRGINEILVIFSENQHRYSRTPATDGANFKKIGEWLPATVGSEGNCECATVVGIKETSEDGARQMLETIRTSCYIMFWLT